MTGSGSWRRAIGAVSAGVWLLAVFVAPGQGHAQPTLSSDHVDAALAEIAARPGASDAHGRFLALGPSLSALAPARQRHWLQRIASASRTAPLLAARARLALSDFDEASSARSHLAALGLVRQWLVTGSSPVDGVRDAHRALFETWDDERTWRPVGQGGPPGGISLDHARRPDRESVIHLITRVEASRRTAATLRVGCGGAIALSLDGRVLGSARGLAFAAPDQLEVDLTLEPGDHWLVVTLMPSVGRPADFYARLTDRAGRELRAVRTSVPAAVPARLKLSETDNQLVRWSSSLASLRMSGPAARTELYHAIVRRALGLPDLESGRAVLLEDLLLTRRVAELGVTDILAALAQVRRSEARASVLSYLVSRGRDDPLFGLGLAELAAERGQLFQARQLLSEIRAARPGSDRRGGGPSAVALADARVDRLDGIPETAWLLLAERAVAPGAAERVIVEAAQSAMEIARPDEAVVLLSGLAAEVPGRLEHGAALAQALVSVGRHADAVDVYQRLAARRPERLTYAIQAAQLAVATKRFDLARRLLGSVRQRARLDAGVCQQLATIYVDLGDTEEARVLYELALALRPASHEARQALERLGRLRVTEPPFQLALTAERLARTPIDPAASFEVLTEEVIYDVRADGSAVKWVRRTLRAQQVPDSRDGRTVFIRFDPSAETVRVLNASILRDGLSLAVRQREVRQVSEAWYGLYYDLRELAVPFDDLRRGDVIDVSWRVDPTATLFEGVFNEIEILQSRVPRHATLVTIDAPVDLKLRQRLSLPPGIDQRRFRSTRKMLGAGRERLQVAGDAVPGLDAELEMPGTAEVAAIWQVSSFQSWRQVADWYHRLIAPQRVMTPAMSAYVERVAAEVGGQGPSPPSETVLIQRLVERVTRDIRYVGLEFGVHGYKPYRTDHVWVRRFGDCKDQATLLTTLLGAAGVDARVVLVRTRKQGRVPEPLSSLALFDHAMVWIADRDLYVDPTANSFGLGELPREVQASQVLILDEPGQGPTKVTLSPVDRPSRSGIEGFYSIALRPDGSAGVNASVTTRGVHAAPYRRLLADPDRRHDNLEKVLNRRYPGLSLKRFETSDPAATGQPVTLTFSAEVSTLAATSSGSLQVLRPAGGDGFAQRFAVWTKRAHPLVLGPPTRWALEFRYLVPAGFRPHSIPSDASQQGPFGHFSVNWHDEGNALRVASELTIEVDQVGPADYESFRRFVQRFDEAVRPPLVLIRHADEP